jgi:hypothetical protein
VESQQLAGEIESEKCTPRLCGLNTKHIAPKKVVPGETVCERNDGGVC